MLFRSRNNNNVHQRERLNTGGFNRIEQRVREREAREHTANAQVLHTCGWVTFEGTKLMNAEPHAYDEFRWCGSERQPS